MRISGNLLNEDRSEVKMKHRRLQHFARPISRPIRIAISLALLLIALPILSGCGSSSSFMNPPIVLSVSLNPTVPITSNNVPIGVQVTIMAPTETATFSIIGLPGGLSYSYKESESNPSGLLTLTAATTTVAGTYRPVITVGSSGQTATTSFALVVSAPTKSAVNLVENPHPHPSN